MPKSLIPKSPISNWTKYGMGLKEEFLKAKLNKLSNYRFQEFCFQENSAFSPIRHSKFRHSVQFGIQDFGIQEFSINFNWAYNISGLSPIFQSAEHIYEKEPDPGGLLKTWGSGSSTLIFLLYFVGSVADYYSLLSRIYCSVVDPGSGAFLTPGSGLGFFRIPDLWSRFPNPYI